MTSPRGQKQDGVALIIAAHPRGKPAKHKLAPGSLVTATVDAEELKRRLSKTAGLKIKSRGPRAEAAKLLGTANAVISAGPIKRRAGRPRVEDRDKTLAATKPWEALGMSRATWYNRRREGKAK